MVTSNALTPAFRQGTVNQLNDSAALSGGWLPTGSLTFRLYDPSQTTCARTPAYVFTAAVTGAGTYVTTPGFAATSRGIWRWTVEYSGDGSNTALVTSCGSQPVRVR